MTDSIEKYILDHIAPENSVLKELDRQTHLSVVQPRMLSGHLQGDFLRMLVKMINPQRILELGTFTGYSAIAMASGLSEGALLHTIEIDDELESIATRHFAKAGLQSKIKQHFGNALDIIPTLGEVFDMVFIDADKREYPAYYELIMSSKYVRKGTIILADNVLWSGKVVEPVSANDRYTQGVLNFNKMVAQDSHVEKVIMPLRDGLTIIRVAEDL